MKLSRRQTTRSLPMRRLARNVFHVYERRSEIACRCPCFQHSNAAAVLCVPELAGKHVYYWAAETSPQLPLWHKTLNQIGSVRRRPGRKIREVALNGKEHLIGALG